MFLFFFNQDTLTFSKVDPNDPQGLPFIIDPSSGRIILVEPLSGQATFSVSATVSLLFYILPYLNVRLMSLRMLGVEGH